MLSVEWMVEGEALRMNGVIGPVVVQRLDVVVVDLVDAVAANALSQTLCISPRIRIQMRCKT